MYPTMSVVAGGWWDIFNNQHSPGSEEGEEEGEEEGAVLLLLLLLLLLPRGRGDVAARGRWSLLGLGCCPWRTIESRLE